ncbi:Fic family protein [Candidatus Nomurabacteria bacterium]|nr:Fic family protein [Candidatus Nomurabacteria bacterium]
MAGHSRYNVSSEQAGIKNGVLKNKLGISDQKQIEDAETILLSDAYDFFLSKNRPGLGDFDVKFLFILHKYFLGTLYDWAGNIREVDMSKGGMMFASAKHMGSSMKYLDKVLKDSLPKNKDTKNTVASKIALIHNEFNAVHPFRDGNGRTIRLFIDLLIFSLGYKIINWNSTSKREYINACISGAVGKNKPMTDFILKRLKSNSKK